LYGISPCWFGFQVTDKKTRKRKEKKKNKGKWKEKRRREKALESHACRHHQKLTKGVLERERETIAGKRRTILNPSYNF
jgi:hypothetical protein